MLKTTNTEIGLSVDFLDVIRRSYSKSPIDVEKHLEYMVLQELECHGMDAYPLSNVTFAELEEFVFEAHKLCKELPPSIIPIFCGYGTVIENTMIKIISKHVPYEDDWPILLDMCVEASNYGSIYKVIIFNMYTDVLKTIDMSEIDDAILKACFL